MLFRKILCCCKLLCSIVISFAQSSVENSLVGNRADTIKNSIKENQYKIGSGKILIYPKPKTFSFITNLPKDAAGIASAPFRKKNIKPLLFVTASTVLLLFADQSVTNRVRQFSSNMHLHPEEDYRNIWSIKLGSKDVSLLKAPNNANTAIYQLGQGFPSLLIGASLFTYGKIYKNYRAESTAIQLAESFILMGVGAQVIKRITGRQSPAVATGSGGKWHFFPSFKNYQNNTPYYDAFPSGHIATLMSTITILADNYTEKKWIKPIGYALTGLVGFSMINNNVHWISDYPLAIALGYLCAKQVVKNHRRVMHTPVSNKTKATLLYTFNYANGKFMPGIVYKF